MAKGLTYLDFAEADYEALKVFIDTDMVNNLMCYTAQKVCERYLKHLLDTYTEKTAEDSVMHTHSLVFLRRVLQEDLPDFYCDWSEVLKAEGYYYTTTYPGDNAFMVSAGDTKACVEAVNYTRRVVYEYIEKKEQERSTMAKALQSIKIVDNEKVQDTISEFDS